MTTKRPTMLSEQDEKIAVARLMAGAQAHQKTSVYCMNKTDVKPPNIDWFYFNVVSFELILMSVEQSLRLLLLLHYGIIRADTGHVPHVLTRRFCARAVANPGYEGISSPRPTTLAALKGFPLRTKRRSRRVSASTTRPTRISGTSS